MKTSSEESINLWRLRYESLLKGLNDVTNELNVLKSNKSFELNELRDEFHAACEKGDFFELKYLTSPPHVNNIFNFFLPHLQKPVESEWISVDDRLPTNSIQEVICVRKTKDSVNPYSVPLTWRDGKFQFFLETYVTIPDVTHWQPLPKPPTK